MILLVSTNFYENLNMLDFEGFKRVLRVLTTFLGFGVLIFEFSVLELVYWQIYGKISVVLFEKF